MNLDRTMFREYDIRGLVKDNQLNAKSVYAIGMGIASFLAKEGNSKLLVGRDSRASSAEFRDLITRALTASGMEVVDLGMCLVPMFYYGQYLLKIKAGVYISASHNPANWNGFKIANDYSSTLLGDDLKTIYEIIKKEDFISKPAARAKISNFDIGKNYSDQLLKKLHCRKPLKVVIDCGNATAGPIVPAIFQSAGFEVVKLYCDLDSSFPNHEPNPSAPENKADLSKKVKDEGANIGFSFDTDGDRLGVVDEKGNIIEADQYLILLARELLSQNPGAKIIFDVKSTRALADDITAHGGKPIMWKTGHSYIKAKMRQEGALLAGEVSGHVFYQENYGFDDAVFSALKLACFLSSSHKIFSQLMATVPHYESTPTLNANCNDKIKYQVVNKLTKEFQKEYNVNTINGARVEFKDGWGLIRPSSNLPVLVLRFEAKTQESLQKIINIFKAKMSRFKEIDMNWYNG
ncbi:phosphomannomutase/phosphoglucomutase [Candidatus Gottesmanbacteria bacterium]|nr:phosphomannomutase/phosphoglucomutase [Candidatus Gottesmanbacteria bacterium]